MSYVTAPRPVTPTRMTTQKSGMSLFANELEPKEKLQDLDN